MSTITLTNKIQRVAVIDDDKQAREAMGESIIDANLKPVIQNARLNSLAELIDKLKTEADAAIFDHRLKPKNYAAFQGAEAVAKLYDARFPALLITAWSAEDIDNIRPHRRKIPVMIKSGRLEAKDIQSSLGTCLAEFGNNYTNERKPHRVLLRIEDVDNQFAYVIIPSWDPKNGIKLPLAIFPQKFHIRPDIRLFAEVNIGASRNEDLYFDKLELAEQPGDSYANPIRT